MTEKDTTITALGASGAAELRTLFDAVEAVTRRVLTDTGTLEAIQSNSQAEVVMTIAIRTGAVRLMWREKPIEKFETLADLHFDAPVNVQ